MDTEGATNRSDTNYSFTDPATTAADVSPTAGDSPAAAVSPAAASPTATSPSPSPTAKRTLGSVAKAAVAMKRLESGQAAKAPSIADVARAAAAKSKMANSSAPSTTATAAPAVAAAAEATVADPPVSKSPPPAAADLSSANDVTATLTTTSPVDNRGPSPDAYEGPAVRPSLTGFGAALPPVTANSKSGGAKGGVPTANAASPPKAKEKSGGISKFQKLMKTVVMPLTKAANNIQDVLIPFGGTNNPQQQPPAAAAAKVDPEAAAEDDGEGEGEISSPRPSTAGTESVAPPPPPESETPSSPRAPSSAAPPSEADSDAPSPLPSAAPSAVTAAVSPPPPPKADSTLLYQIRELEQRLVQAERSLASALGENKKLREQLYDRDGAKAVQHMVALERDQQRLKQLLSKATESLEYHRAAHLAALDEVTTMKHRLHQFGDYDKLAQTCHQLQTRVSILTQEKLELELSRNEAREAARAVLTPEEAEYFKRTTRGGGGPPSKLPMVHVPTVGKHALFVECRWAALCEDCRDHLERQQETLDTSREWAVAQRVQQHEAQQRHELLVSRMPRSLQEPWHMDPNSLLREQYPANLLLTAKDVGQQPTYPNARGWREMIDPSNGSKFYYNAITNQSSLTKPY